MIVLINGAFGVGKTSVANKLLKKMPDSMIFDPEEVGFMLRNIIPQHIKGDNEKTGDFQDLDLWRVLTVNVAEELKIKYRKNLIIPMTIRNFDYYTYIKEGFKKFDNEILCFCLMANKEIIHKRLVDRGDKIGSWAFEQTDKCLENFNNYNFGEYVNTEKLDLNGVVELIVNRVKK